MLKVTNLNAGYVKHHVLFDITLDIKEKDIAVIVGPNGSGKSTLLKAIFGLTNIFSGSIFLNSDNIVNLSPHAIARLGLAYLPQTDNIFADLSIKDNLLMSSYTINSVDSKKRISEILNIFPILSDLYNSKAGNLSGGQRQMLAMGMSLIRKPKIMLFDEPTGHLSPKLANNILNTIIELRDKFGITIILVEQNAKKALEIADKAHLFVGGKINFSGNSKDLLKHKQLNELYLGITKFK